MQITERMISKEQKYFILLNSIDQNSVMKIIINNVSQVISIPKSGISDITLTEPSGVEFNDIRDKDKMT